MQERSKKNSEKSAPNSKKPREAGKLLMWHKLTIGGILILLFLALGNALQAQAEETDETDATPVEVETVQSEEEAPGFWDRINSVKGFIVEGDTSALAEHVESDLESRFAALEKREEAARVEDLRLTHAQRVLDSKTAEIDAVKNCILSAVGGDS